MVKREAKMQTIFKHYLQHKWCGYPAAFELKRTLGMSLPFSDVKDHQEAALIAIEDKGLYYKISDSSIGYKPFDCFYLSGIPGYVVIGYGEKLTSFIMIRISEWMAEKKRGDRKSLTYERAREIGDEIFIK